MMRPVLAIAAALLVLPLLTDAAPRAEPLTLETVRERVIRDYPHVRRMSPLALSQALKDSQEIILIDVREPREFAVSRLPGAERVDPGMGRRTFLDRFAAKARGRTVVFYCAVGYRSSRLAKRVQAALKRQGALAVFNLDGGVFAWHGEERPLVDAKGPTPYVHPFNRSWGRLVTHQDYVRDQPRP